MPGPIYLMLVHEEEVAEHGGVLRIMKLMENVELFQVVSENQSLWK